VTEWGTTLGLAALMIGLFGWLRADVRAVRRDLDRLNSRVGALGERMAHLEGLLEGLRESVTGRQAA
jgi:ubiquinone biosynthesis protein UbiJ